jgi:hypothetical protein
LTQQRYLATLAFQKLFNLWYWDTTIRVPSKKSTIMPPLLLAVVVGVIWGYRTAEEQYQYLYNPSAVHVTMAAPGLPLPTCALHTGESASSGSDVPLMLSAQPFMTQPAILPRAELQASELRAFSLA